MLRIPVVVAVVLLLGCEEEQSAPPPTLEEPAAELVEVEPAPIPPRLDPQECATSDDCVLFSPCCGGAPSAITRQQLAAELEVCARVRCARPRPRDPRDDPVAARCTDARCVAVHDPRPEEIPEGRRCESDDDCTLHSPCCSCLGRPLAYDRETARINRENCARRTCAACAETPRLEQPTGVRCDSGMCVEVFGGD